MLRFWILLTLCVLSASTSSLYAEDFVVYSVQKGLDFGNPGETPQKDYFITMGSQNGLRNGAMLEVLRKTPTYDIRGEKLYKDMAYPFAKLKVIHVESNGAIARLDKFLPVEKTPIIQIPAIIVGDLVRRAE